MKYNFSSGPATLPQEVLNQLNESINNFKNTGLSILEIYHRSQEFNEIFHKAKTLVKELLQIDNSYEILFLHGGASLQFVMIPYNFLDKDETAAFFDTGVWTQKAILQAQKFGQVDIIASSKDVAYKEIPKQCTISKKYKYLYICSNNSIYGTAWNNYPEAKVPIIADMTSDLLTKKIDINKFSFIYASFQKNLGIAGGAIAIIKKEFLENSQIARSIPDILNYSTQIKSGSLYNTPPVCAIYVAYLMLKWCKECGGLDYFDEENKKKAQLLYDCIDSSSIFTNTINKADRSRSTIVFEANNKSIEEDFLAFAEKNNCVGIKGHRNVGGFRVALFNAIKYEAVKHLVNVMKEYEKTILSK